jgi:hypothetical protein
LNLRLETVQKEYRVRVRTRHVVSIIERRARHPRRRILCSTRDQCAS